MQKILRYLIAFSSVGIETTNIEQTTGLVKDAKDVMKMSDYHLSCSLVSTVIGFPMSELPHLVCLYILYLFKHFN